VATNIFYDEQLVSVYTDCYEEDVSGVLSVA
jgi:hypothetical protein